jgi:hypothetical protein
MFFPSRVRLLFLAPVLLLAVVAASPAGAAEGWPSLHLRGFAMRPCQTEHPAGNCAGGGDIVDTLRQNYYNQDQNVFLLWDRDSLMEQRPDFGGYSVYRSIGPDTLHMTLLRRYVLRPARLFGTAERNPANGSTSRYWTFRDDRLPGVGLFIDPDSILQFNRVPVFASLIKGVISYDTVYQRGKMPGPKNGFDYYYAVTYCDTTENAPDLTFRSANLVGPVRPTGAAVRDNLDLVKVVPNPYTFRTDWDLPGQRKILFTNLPVQVKIDVFTTTGELVRTLNHNSSVENSEPWDMKNGSDQDIGSGIYIFRLETPEGRSRISRFTVIR